MARPDIDTPLRSMLFIPGSSEKMVGKGPTIEADAALFDLEDSVAPQMKEEARKLVRAGIAETMNAPNGPSTILVRVNDVESGMLEEDIDAIVAEGPGRHLSPQAGGGRGRENRGCAFGEIRA